MAKKIIAIANQKGGVGKTTTAISLGYAISTKGERVLVVDFDPHSSATFHLSLFPETLEKSIYDAMTGSCAQFKDVILETRFENLHIVPSHINLSRVESDMKNTPGRGLILKNLLSEVADDYDYILIDCSPAMGLLLINALMASSEVMITIQSDFLALHGVKLLLDTIAKVDRIVNKNIVFKALITMYDKRLKASGQVIEIVKEKFQNLIYNTMIHIDTRFKEASAEGLPIGYYAKWSRGAIEYANLADEVMKNG